MMMTMMTLMTMMRVVVGVLMRGVVLMMRNLMKMIQAMIEVLLIVKREMTVTHL